MRIGIDLGGTKIEAIALSETGETLFRERIRTPADDYQATLLCIKDLIEQIEAQSGRSGSIGVGTPGSLSPTSGLIRNANSVCLNGKAFDKDIEQFLGRPVRVANDADCFTLSEATDGAASGAHNVFGVILGTGTGGGIVIRQHLVQGPNAISGEWGHNPLPWPSADELPGPGCYCGKRGCIETYLSGPGLEHSYFTHSGSKIPVKQIVSLAEQGEEVALKVMALYIDRLARGLASVINLLDPEIIVLGGGLSNIQSLYEQVPRRLPDYVFSDQVSTKLVPALHGDSSGVRGAAWLWDNGDNGDNGDAGNAGGN